MNGSPRKQLSDDVGVDGFVGMHGPRVQLRKANGQSDKSDDDESVPSEPNANEGPRSPSELCRNEWTHAAGLPHTSTSM